MIYNDRSAKEYRRIFRENRYAALQPPCARHPAVRLRDQCGRCQNSAAQCDTGIIKLKLSAVISGIAAICSLMTPGADWVVKLPKRRTEVIREWGQVQMGIAQRPASLVAFPRKRVREELNALAASGL